MTSRIDSIAPPGTLFKKPGALRPKIKGSLRNPRQEDKAHLAAIRQCPCLGCGEDPAGEAAHVRMASAAHNKRSTGMQEKPDDKWTLPLCKGCHREQHRIGELHFWHHIQLSPFLICERLYAASPNVEAMRAICFAARLDGTVERRG